MKIEFNTLHWDNVDKNMLEAHQRVMKHFGLPVNYHNLTGFNHGKWMDEVVKRSESDVVCIIEPDCIPLNKDKLLDTIKYAYTNNTFVGIAQVSNHILPRSHIYAAPGYYAITPSIYKELGTPSFSETHRSDTAEEISYIAEERGKRYRALMPTYFTREPGEGAWPLSNLGYYGVGTVFDDTVYHLFQSRLAENVQLFVDVCDQVIAGTFTTDNLIPSTTFSFKGKTVA